MFGLYRGASRNRPVSGHSAVMILLLLSEVVGIHEAEHLLCLQIESIARALMLEHLLIILHLLHLSRARVHFRLVVQHAVLVWCVEHGALVLGYIVRGCRE